VTQIEVNHEEVGFHLICCLNIIPHVSFVLLIIKKSNIIHSTFLILEEQLSAPNESLRKKDEELTALKHSFGMTDQNYAGSRKKIRGIRSIHGEHFSSTVCMYNILILGILVLQF
jgi:hypothetical protein